MPTQSPLQEAIRQAGYDTDRSFAEVAGLRDYELSRINSPSSGRRPTLAQINKIAAALGMAAPEVAKLILPDHDVFSTQLLAHTEPYMEELAETRSELVRYRARCTAAESQLSQLSSRGDEVSRLQYELGCREQDLVNERGRNDALHQENTNLRQRLKQREFEIDACRRELQDTHDTLAREHAQLLRQLNDLENELGREKLTKLRGAILAGTLGTAVGAILAGTATAVHRRRKK